MMGMFATACVVFVGSVLGLVAQVLIGFAIMCWRRNNDPERALGEAETIGWTVLGTWAALKVAGIW